MITRRQVRSVMADGGRLIDPVGQPVGRIVDVELDWRTSQPAWVTVDCALCIATEVVVPLDRARLLDGCVQLPYTAAEVCDAPRGAGSGSRLDERRAEERRRYYARLDVTAPPWPDERPTDAALGLLPAVAGLHVRTGDDSPAAYPSTPSGPWPVVTNSSSGPPWWQRRQWRWPSRLTSVRTMRAELRPVLDLTGLPHHELEDLILASGEAANNAVEHARSPTLPFFDVSTEVGERGACIVIQAHGRWRTPAAGGDRGRGLQMMGRLADATLTVGPRGTTVVLRNRPGDAR